MLVPRVIKQKVMGSQVRTWKSKARKSKVKYQWWRGVDRSKIINMARNSQVKNERLGSRRSQVKDYSVIMVVVSKVTGPKSVGLKVCGVEGRSGQRLWCNYGRSVKAHGSKVGRVKGQWSRRSVRSKILVSYVMVSNIIGQRCWCQGSSSKRSWGHRSELGNQRPGSQSWNISDEEAWIGPK